MKTVFLMFDGIAPLDAIGPYEVLRSIPGMETLFVGETSGVKRAGRSGLGLHADYALADVKSADILLVPGGFGEEQVRATPHALQWVRDIDKTTQWTTSVCTGALILGAAGLLKGLKATTHWAQLEKLSEFGAIPTRERVVEQGKVITAAGVASGIDMALHLARRVAGDEIAHAIQIGIEYDPQPPFDGSPYRAPAPVLEMIRQAMEASRAAQ
jgi:transcriptional regulator GlxA family with amidase domain